MRSLSSVTNGSLTSVVQQHMLYIAGLAAVARLGVADVLADGQVHPVDDIAKQTGSKPEPLYRLLRWVASHGVFEETNDHQFRMNEKASLLKV